MYKISVPATSANLSVGFDTLGIAFDLYNEFYVDYADKFSLVGFDEGFNKEDNNLFIKAYKSFFKKFGLEIIPISAYTRMNINLLLDKAAELLKTTTLDEFEENDIDKVVEYRFEKPEDPFTIEKTEEGIYNVVGPEIKRLFDATNFDKDESVRMFARKLRLLGVDAKLRELGVKNDDTVLILGYEFEFYD